MSFLKTVPSATCVLWDKSIVLFKRVYIEGTVLMKPVVYFLFRSCSYIIILMNVDYNGWAGKFVCALCVCFSICTLSCIYKKQQQKCVFFLSGKKEEHHILLCI